MKLSTLLLTPLAVATIGCKWSVPTNASEVQTLDNFAAADTVRVNACTPDNQLHQDWVAKDRIKFGTDLTLDENTKSQYREIVKQYVAAVPVEIQAAFLNFGGQILLTGRAKTDCTPEMKSPDSPQYVAEKRQAMEACMKFASENGQSVLAIYQHLDPTKSIEENKKTLQHSGVRVVGLTFGQFFTKLAPNIDPSGLPARIPFRFTGTDTTAMSSVKLRLANAFFQDMALSKVYKLENLAPLIGASSSDIIRQYFLDAQGNLKASAVAQLNSDSEALMRQITFRSAAETNITPQQRMVRQQRLEDFLFGEAFDSYHCSSNTLAVMRQEFPASESMFGQINASIIQVATHIATATAPIAAQDAQRTAAANGNGINPELNYNSQPLQTQQGPNMTMLLVSELLNSARPLFEQTSPSNDPGGCPNCAQCTGAGCTQCSSCVSGNCACGCANCAGGACAGGCSSCSCAMG